jgi:plastocyanin
LSAAIIVAAAAAAFGQQMTVTGRVELSDAVVWLTPTGSFTPVRPTAAPTNLRLLQKKKTFSPHLLVVPVGSLVAFPNQDPFFHNVFSLFEGKRFDLGLYEAGSSRSVVFNREGVSYIFCNIHPEMSAVVVALKTPYYGISDRNGVVTIPNVLAGSYEIEVWHERVLPESLSAAKHMIVISPAANSFGTIHLTEQRNASRTHKNKYGHDYDNPNPSAPVYTRP